MNPSELEALAGRLNEAHFQNAIQEVVKERLRQVLAEGFDVAHDDTNDQGELAAAAAVYALPDEDRTEDMIHALWPFSESWLKSTTRQRDLVKAAALILAELERLSRLEEKTNG